MATTTIIIALGSNRCHGRHGRPAGILRAAIAALAAEGLVADKVSPIMMTRAIGPGGRNFANAAMSCRSSRSAVALLAILKRVERDFGRKHGRRWGARVLDLDLIARGQDIWPSRFTWGQARSLAVPHRGLHDRDFVLAPMMSVAADWRHPVFNLSTRQMRARLKKRNRAVDLSARAP